MFFALDVGGTSIKAGVFDSNINLLKQYKVSYIEEVKTSQFPTLLIDYIFNLYSKAEQEFNGIKSIGCGVPGVVSDEGIISVAPNLCGIINFPIKELVCDKIKLPFAVDNDANVAALAELYKGNGTIYDNFVYITLGTGIGGAIIENKKLFRGSSGGAGEIGHTFIDLEASKIDDSYRTGSLETYAGRDGILNLANKLKANYPNSKLNTLQNIDVKDISIFAKDSDSASLQILEIIGYKIGIALTNIANLLDIPNFIIGGGISQSEYLLSIIRNTLKNKSLPSISNRINLLPAFYQADTGIYGAAILAKTILD